MIKKYEMIIISLVSIFFVVLLMIFSVQGCKNKAIALEEQVNSASSDINVQEKRRADLLYNLVDTVKAYDKHESETLKSVIEARGSKDVNISDVTTMISATAEAYPELKSNENYKQLMNELSTTENLISQYRSNYNVQVKEYNRYVRKFPSSQFLDMTGYDLQEYEYLEYQVSKDAPQNLFGE